MKRTKPRATALTPVALLGEVRQLILEARQQTARVVNAGLTLLSWQIGNRVRREILKEKRAEYGATIVSTLGRQLEVEFGRGFSEKSLRHMVRFAEAFPDEQIVSALLRQLSWSHFLSIIELGSGFAFIERQKRITLDGDDYYMDLLFYHRRLRRLVVIELKIGDFKPADAGQVELYLRWLDRNERQKGEEKPIALILCAGKKRETVEYLDLGRSSIHVSAYLTELPPRELLQQRLHDAVIRARLRLEQQAAKER